MVKRLWVTSINGDTHIVRGASLNTPVVSYKAICGFEFTDGGHIVPGGSVPGVCSACQSLNNKQPEEMYPT
jgi:hypothetical protein